MVVSLQEGKEGGWRFSSTLHSHPAAQFQITCSISHVLLSLLSLSSRDEVPLPWDSFLILF